MAPKITIRDVAITERPVRFAHPFRFGTATVDEANEIFVHVEIDVDGAGLARGAAAELMMPKWFDKNPALSPAESVAELRFSLDVAARLYRQHQEPETAFGIHAACYRPLMDACAKEGVPALAAAYGAAEIDKAILDALLRALKIDTAAGLGRNAMGLDARLTPDLDMQTIEQFLSSRVPRKQIFVRHTVGLVDSLDALASAARAQGLHYFKIKLGGDPTADRDRLIAISRALDAVAPDHWLTLDANEQYADAKTLTALTDALARDDAFQSLRRRLLYIEQPLPRERTFSFQLDEAGSQFAFIIDEADDDYDAFPRAVELGYRGVSSKSCKGIYKSLLNGARALRWNAQGANTFVAAEDLTCQAGLAVQQDTALAAFHEIAHCERNGHHYSFSFAAAPRPQAQAFLDAHPDLYEMSDGEVRLRVSDGTLAIGSLFAAPGFASAVDPALIDSQPCTDGNPIKEMVS
jgi:L-alanine-DL-glutamate epimerase-like enolase superfamily enzyme